MAGKDLEKSLEAEGFEHDFESGLAVVPPDKITDPGLEPHRERVTDKIPAKAKDGNLVFVERRRRLDDID